MSSVETWIVMGTRGEYSDTEVWVCSAWPSEALARAEAERLTAAIKAWAAAAPDGWDETYEDDCPMRAWRLAGLAIDPAYRRGDEDPGYFDFGANYSVEWVRALESDHE